VAGGYPAGDTGGGGADGVVEPAGSGAPADGCGLAGNTWRQAKQETDTDGWSVGTWFIVPQLGQRAWNMAEEIRGKT
jgi:hypothetical protein